MSNTKKPDERYNADGYIDMTAYEALRRIRQEKRSRVIALLKAIAKENGYEIVNQIYIKELDQHDSN